MGDYAFVGNNLISIILLIIPFTSWLCGFIARIQDGKIVAAIIRIFGGFHIIWLLDVVMTILNGCQVNICRIIPV